MLAALDHDVVIRRGLENGDVDAIGDLHERIYVAEYGMNDAFCQSVRDALAQALDRGWPEAGGAVWLLDGERGLAGSLGLTVEAPGVGRVRWFVLDPQLRGRGIGAQLVGELVAEARAAQLERLELETFSDLRTAARIYRGVGFKLVSSRLRSDWGRPIVYQRYELSL
jgi:GNAT superfamily N-acetyltransferase